MSVTVEDILENPSKYGVPTFGEFAKDPEKFRDSLDKKLGRFDRGTQVFKNIVEKQTYKIAGFEVKSLEEVERIAREEGMDLNGCKFVPQVIPSGNGKCRIVVEFKVPVMSRILDALGKPFRKS